MVIMLRRTSLLLSIVALTGTTSVLGAADDSTLLRSTEDGVEALGGTSHKGGSHSHSKHYQRVGQIDTVLATITVEGACPSDYTLSNNQCIQTGPSGISCPEGFTEEESAFPGTTPEVIFRNRTCAFFALEVEPLVNCATGSLDGITCFEFQDVAPDFVGCDPGFELTPQGCVFSDVAPLQAPRCEQGELGPGNGCFDVQAVAPTLVCEGEAFIGDDGQTCVTRTPAGAAVAGCDAGFTLQDDGLCLKTETAGTVPSCEGLPGSLQGNQCIEFRAVAADTNCGEGFDLVNNGCIAFEDQAPQFACPPGFTSLNDQQCEKKVEVPPVAQCSTYEAFFDAELQACVVVTLGDAPTLECEEGAVVQNGACAFVQQAAPTAFCADPDFILTNTPSGDAQVCQQCLSTGIIGGGIRMDDYRGGHHGHHAHKHAVEEGKEEDDASVKPNTAEAVPSANVRRLEETTSTTEEEVDETAPDQAPPTANSTTYRKHHGGHHHGSEEGVIDEQLGGGETFACTTAAPSFQCGTGFILTGDECIQIEDAAGIAVCASGFTLSADQSACELRAQSPAIFSCEDGFTLSADSALCSFTDTAAKNTECPEGSDFVGGLCVNVQINQAINFSCGPGLELQGTECVEAAAVAAGFGCPEGFSFGDDETTCTRTSTQPGRGECEVEGASVEGDQCFRYPGVAATASCGDGAVLTDGQCQTFNLIAAAVLCAEGFEQVDDQCVRQQVDFPNIECPVGSFIQDGGCVTANGIAAEAVCPEGLVAVPIKNDTEFGCFELQAPRPSCPFGQELTVGDECIITAIAPSDTPTIAPPRGSGKHGHKGHGGHGGHGHH